MFKKIIVVVHLLALLFFSWKDHFSLSDHDESIYLGAGTLIWHEGQVANKMTEVHPPFTYYMNSIFLGPNPVDWGKLTDWSSVAKQEENPRQAEFKLHFLQSIGRDILAKAGELGKSLSALLFLARLPFVLLSAVFLLALIEVLEKVDPWIRYLCITMYGLGVTVLYLVPGIMTDIPMIIFSMFALFSLSRYLAKKTWKTLAWTGIYLGLAIGSKVSAVILIPCMLGVIVFEKIEKENPIVTNIMNSLQESGVVLIVCFMTLWAVYGFQVDSLARVEKLHHIFPVHEMNHEDPPVSKIQKEYPRFYEMKLPMISLLMPLRLVFHRRGLLIERTTIEGPFRNLRETNWYPWTVMITYFSTSFLLLLIIGVVQMIRKRAVPLERASFPFVLFSLLYGGSCFTSNYLYGVRHVFPIFLPVMIWLAFSLNTVKDIGTKKYRYTFMVLTAVVLVEAVLFMITGHPWSLWMYGAHA